jgi:acyl-CoA reductase-like NAD-dependent aldehyde dehydrogenase
MVHESLYDAVIERVVERVGRIKVGDPLDTASEMGPVNSEGHYRHVVALIESAREQGAKLLTGGERPEGEEFERGYWIRPTVFGDVTMDMRIARDEVFGPVLSVLRWSDTSDAIEMANGTEYGLTAGIWTNDVTTAMRTARQIESGCVWINGGGRHFMSTGFSGYKNSGIGREECLDELLSYTQSKSIHIIL